MGKKALRETPEEDMTRFKQIRDSTGNARLKALYKEMVDASFGKEFLLPWFAAPTGRPDISK
jgi:hypothetical protein